MDVDEDGYEVKDPNGQDRFKCARNGDHLITPFQCDLCQFRNIYSRDPVESFDKDREALIFIRQANLDALWGREPSTVKSNLKEAIRMERSSERFGFESVTPPMGPYPLEDSFGMKSAMSLLDRSLDKGIYEEFVQWDTFRRNRSAVTNISQAGHSGLSDTIGAYERKRLWISTVPTHSFWYTRFMTGVHKRVGQIKKQDKEVTIDVLHAVDVLLEQEWKQALTRDVKKRTAEMGAWFIGGFCTGLRGEEMLLIEFAGTAKELAKLKQSRDPHFSFVVTGRTKGNQVSGSKFKVPCVGTTEGTGLKPGRWVKRLVDTLKASGKKKGRLFTRLFDPPKLLEFQDDFFRILERIQVTQPDLIDSEVDVRDEYGIYRSLRRGVTSHARNVGVPDDLVKVFNRWRSEMTRGLSALDMIEYYSTLEALLPTLLRYPRAL